MSGSGGAGTAREVRPATGRQPQLARWELPRGELIRNSGRSRTTAGRPQRWRYPGKPCHRRGNAAVYPGSDQRGMARPSGPNCDIGAYEFQDVSPPPDPVITQAPPDPRRSLGIDLLHRRRVRRRVQLLPGRWTGDDLRVVRHVRRPHGGRPLLLRASRRRFGERVVGRVGDVVRRRLAAARPRDHPGSARPERSLGIGLLHGRRGRRGVQLLPGRWTGDRVHLAGHVRRAGPGTPQRGRPGCRLGRERVGTGVLTVDRRGSDTAARPRHHRLRARPERSLRIGFFHRRRGWRGVHLLAGRGPEAACSSPVSYAGLVDGPHSFSVRAVDASGNASNAASVVWTADLSPPPVPVIRASSARPEYLFVHRLLRRHRGRSGVRLLAGRRTGGHMHLAGHVRWPF